MLEQSQNLRVYWELGFFDCYFLVDLFVHFLEFVRNLHLW